MSHDDLSKYTTGAWTGDYGKIFIDIQDGEEAQAIAEAAQADNPEVEIIENLGYLTIRCPKRLVIRQEAVEEVLGRPWNPRDLQQLLSAYAGNFTSAGQNGQWVLEWLGDSGNGSGNGNGSKQPRTTGVGRAPKGR